MIEVVTEIFSRYEARKEYSIRYGLVNLLKQNLERE